MPNPLPRRLFIRVTAGSKRKWNWFDRMSLPARCGRALAVFLLTANTGLCFCRAGSEPAQDQEVYRLQSCISASPAPEEVESALGALSVAYRCCVREASVLLNEGAAETYLSVRNFNPQSQSAGNKED